MKFYFRGLFFCDRFDVIIKFIYVLIWWAVNYSNNYFSMSRGVVTQFHINGFNAFIVFCQIFTFKTSDAVFHTNKRLHHPSFQALYYDRYYSQPSDRNLHFHF